MEIAPLWVDADLIYKSSYARAMPLTNFIAETLKYLSTATTKVVANRVAAGRGNQGTVEHALVQEFSLSIMQSPIPLA